MSEIAEFHRELMSEVRAAADVDGTFVVEAFIEKVGDILIEAGELETIERSYFEATLGGTSMRVDAHGGDPRDADGTLALIICELQPEDEPQTINADELKRLFRRVTDFLRQSRKQTFRDSIEETSEAFTLSQMIAVTWGEIAKIKLILLTNREKRTRGDGVPGGEIDGRPVTYNIWDIDRIRRFVASGQAREDLVVDFATNFGGTVPVLQASGADATRESYLAVIPGIQLARIYDKWGQRLLEANVRSFLQARGKVNKGIRETILEEPGMFFSYNNGISATAEAVVVEMTPMGAVMQSARNLQIVNGGQTTASLHAALRSSADKLEQVFVQMKLSVVPPERSEEVVPKISEYANSQNKVSAADFFSNHPFHVRMEEFSRRILAPAGDGRHETKWFYERARGQFAEARGRLSEANRKKFDITHPKSKLMTKTDMAKFEMTWRRHPDIVSHGAQKTFTGLNSKRPGFAQNIGEEWAASDAKFDETWFKRLVAKAIVFRHLESVVPRQHWFAGGYRANVVTYAIARLVEDVLKVGKLIDLDAVWRAQAVLGALEQALLIAAAEAHEVITSPPEGVRNMSEWAKRPACWATLKSRNLEYDDGFGDVLVDPEEARSEVRSTRRSKALTDGIEAQAAVLGAGTTFWVDLRAWGLSRRMLSEREAGILEACSRTSSRLPTEKQCSAAMAILGRLEGAGYTARANASA